MAYFIAICASPAFTTQANVLCMPNGNVLILSFVDPITLWIAEPIHFDKSKTTCWDQFYFEDSRVCWAGGYNDLVSRVVLTMIFMWLSIYTP